MNNYIQSLCVRNKVNSKYCISLRADKALCNIYFAGVTLKISDMHKTDFIFYFRFRFKAWGESIVWVESKLSFT